MPRKRHPNKAIEQAIRQAEREGWGFRAPGKSSHAFGILQCPHEAPDCRCGIYCQFSVWRTPRNSEAEARRILRAVNNCRYRKK